MIEPVPFYPLFPAPPLANNPHCDLSCPFPGFLPLMDRSEPPKDKPLQRAFSAPADSVGFAREKSRLLA